MKGIYKIVSPCGGVYIGQSIKMQSRIRKHKGALRSYGCFNHVISIVHELPEDVSQDILDEYERFYIERYKECGVKVFNHMSGGIKKGTHDEETKSKFSNWQIGRKLSPSHVQNIVKHSTGRFHSEEAKEKIRQGNLGKTISNEQRIKISNSLRGRSISEDQKNKISIAMKGRKFSPETLLKMKMSAPKKKVFQFSKSNEFIKEWDSATNAHLVLNIARGDISSCARGDLKSAGGFIWKYQLNQATENEN